MNEFKNINKFFKKEFNKRLHQFWSLTELQDEIKKLLKSYNKNKDVKWEYKERIKKSIRLKNKDGDIFGFDFVLPKHCGVEIIGTYGVLSKDVKN